jgi:predicted regulator of Ras-like GTPase activity (Roadblock/LC7/MglB family)
LRTFPAALELDPVMPLSEVVQRLAARDGVEAVLLLSGDGLPIEHASRSAVDAETVAALAATLARHAGRLGEGAGLGDVATGVLEFGGGLIILARAGADDWLAVLARSEADIGPLLYDLRQHRTALATLL